MLQLIRKHTRLKHLDIPYSLEVAFCLDMEIKLSMVQFISFVALEKFDKFSCILSVFLENYLSAWE